MQIFRNFNHLHSSTVIFFNWCSHYSRLLLALNIHVPCDSLTIASFFCCLIMLLISTYIPDLHTYLLCSVVHWDFLHEVEWNHDLLRLVIINHELLLMLQSLVLGLIQSNNGGVSLLPILILCQILLKSCFETFDINHDIYTVSKKTTLMLRTIT